MRGRFGRSQPAESKRVSAEVCEATLLFANPLAPPAILLHCNPPARLAAANATHSTRPQLYVSLNWSSFVRRKPHPRLSVRCYVFFRGRNRGGTGWDT